MVISISGPSSTGKTTTVNKILSQKTLGGFDNIVVITETIRDLWAKEFSNYVSDVETMLNDKELTMKWTKAVSVEISNHIEKELSNIDLDKNLVVLDRCCLDHFVYTITNTMKFGITMDVLSTVLENFTRVDEKIDLMFYTEIPENDYFEDDGIRPLNLKDNRKMENNFFKLLFYKSAIKLPYDIEQRIKVIDDSIKKYNK